MLYLDEHSCDAGLQTMEERMARASRRKAGASVWLLAWTLALAVMCHVALAAAQFPLERLDEGGYVVMLRHALAPGVGDPANFRLDDCATQRNLSEEGRAQARRLGERLRAHGVEQAEVYSSQWCRCLETAELLDLGAVEELPALNSFFSRPAEREPTLEVLRAFLAALPEDGPPLILVTHQVTISALAGHGAASGEAVVMKADGTGQPPVVGTIGPE
jgi:phosphohistidine phosphatase SixA